MQVFDLDDLEPVTIRLDEPDVKSTSNLGSGIELLMNTKKLSTSSKRNVHLGEVGEIEDEINRLYTPKPSGSNTLSGFASNLFNFSSNENENETNMDNNNNNLGSATSTCVDSGKSKSHDGFSKINDIPAEFNGYNKLSEREKITKKRKMLRELEKNGNKNTNHCNQDTPYEDVEDEYNTYMEDKRKTSAIRFQRMCFTTFMNTLEVMNGLYDPFNISLDGLSETINDDLDSYDDTFGELYTKYNGVKISPELYLLGRLGFSIGMTIFTNRQLANMPSDYSNVIKQNPILMREFSKTATQMATDANPIFNMFNETTNQSQSNESSYGPPPKPIQTKLPPPSERMIPKSSSRPDIQLGRGSMFHEQGVDMVKDRENVQQDTTILSSSSYQSRPRFEMKGPKDIDFSDFLNGMKPKEKDNNIIEENDSLISVTSMRDMLNQSKPSKKTNRRKISEKNTISLDI